MNHSISYLSGPVADALGWTLLHAVWQGFALVVPVAVVLHLLRGQSSVLRYRVGALTMLVQLFVSIGTFFWYYQPIEVVSGHQTASTAIPALSVRWQTVTQTMPWPQQAQLFLEAHLNQFVLLYLLGVGVFALRLAGGWLYLQRLSQTAVQPAARHLTTLAESLQSAMQIGLAVRVRESARVSVPMVVGVLKPILLLPISVVTHLSVRELEAVLAHELAHVKRHDYAVNLLQSVVEVLYFFHPALWWLSARVREEREHCCDDLAVEAIGGDGRMLAQALARVEELRLTQAAAPALAMAFASKRQQLLHRVRRVLGVPTRPSVSSSSLAGLTLATLLLVSASVYAVQQEPQPKASKQVQSGKSQSTRRHRTDNGTEFSVADNHTIRYVIWKGQRLTATRVAHLQRLLNQVLAGQVSLDDVQQPNRDILLAVLETGNGLSSGMDTLADDLAAIGSDDVTASAQTKAKLAGLAKLDYERIVSEAMAMVDTNIAKRTALNSSDAARNYHQREMDSLSQLIAQRSQQVQALHLQMEKLQFPLEELARAEQVLNWRKEKIENQRSKLIEQHQRLLEGNNKQRLSTQETEKQLTALEPEFKKLEASIEAINKQLEELQTKQEAARLPLEQLEKEAERLDADVERWSEQIGEHGDALVGVLPAVPPVRSAVRAPLGRPARVPRPPRPARPVSPALPAPPGPAVAPTLPAPPPPPRAASPAAKAKVAPTPKPVTAPKPNDR